MGIIKEIVFDCADAPKLARFWAKVIDNYAVRAYDFDEIARLAALGLTPETDPVVMVDGPGPSLCFQQMPQHSYENNRIHLDISVSDKNAEVEKLVSLGASINRSTDTYTVMRDPEGNQFCIVQAR